MLYIKTILNQDKDKEFAFQFGPSFDFFHSDCEPRDGDEREIPLTLEFPNTSVPTLLYILENLLDLAHFNSFS